MKARTIFFGTIGVLVVAAGIGCSNSNTPSNADRATDSTPAASQPAPPPTEWTADRDAYIARRQQDLDELQNQWDRAKAKADRKTREAWRATESDRASMRRDLEKAKENSREAWDSTRQKLDEGWNRIQNKTRDVFHDNDRNN